jgi:hypothetical protein
MRTQYKPDSTAALDSATSQYVYTGGQYNGWSGYFKVRVLVNECACATTKC